MIKTFFKAHGHGWWLHMLGAVAIMLLGWWLGYLRFAFIFNSNFWPFRELWQKRKSLRDYFTLHVFLEWVPAVIVGGIIYAGIIYAVLQ